MDTQHPSAPPCAQPLIRRGITHDNIRLTTRYTVVGNHLVQHRELSLTAIGLAAHIQSLPAGARVDIKTLAARFPEGETRIAAALRELEAHGYLTRTRERLPSGQVVTHTVSYNQPRGLDATPEPRPAPHRKPAPNPVHPLPKPPKAAPAPKPPLPELGNLSRDHDLPTAGHHTAVALLAGLHRDDPRLLLPERDVLRLAPAVTAWLDRGAAPEAVRRTLTASLPGRAPPPPGGLPVPPPQRTPPAPPARSPTDRPPLPAPELRRLRPRLPSPRTRPLPRLPYRPVGGRLA